MLQPLLLAVLACLSIALVGAYPTYYEQDYILTAGDCQRLPSSTNADSESKGFHYNTAGPDLGSTFMVSQNSMMISSGKVGPGQTYNVKDSLFFLLCPNPPVQVSFTNARNALLVASQGSFADPNQAMCPNRVLTQSPVNSHTYAITFPCTLTGPTTLSLTSAVNGASGGSDSNWNMNSLTLTADPTLATTASAASASMCPQSHIHPVAQSEQEFLVRHWTSQPRPPGTGRAPGRPAPGPLSPTQRQPASTAIAVTAPAQPAAALPSLPDPRASSDPSPTPCATLAPTSSRRRGYVAFAFTPNPGNMAGSDTILGWVNSTGNAFISTYNVLGNYISPGQLCSPSWAYQQAVSQTVNPTTHAKHTTICFSRQIKTPLAAYSTHMDLSAPLTYNWAVSPNCALIQHSLDGSGGGVLDVASGVSSQTVDHKGYWINVHGLLMSIAWGLLLPLGTFMPAHRWLLGDVKVGKTALWFILHLAFQLSGFVVFVAGFVVCVLHFDVGSMPSGGVGKAHAYMGWALMGLASLQMIGGAIRPGHDSRLRSFWNPIHHNLGRISILIGWVMIYLGIWIYSVSIYGGSLLTWMTPLVAITGSLLLMHLMLTVLAPKVHSKGEQGVVVSVRSSPNSSEHHQDPDTHAAKRGPLYNVFQTGSKTGI
ncbi:MAG: hypothetical protein WDW38_009990 [Sanguina aurantia]